MGAEVPGASIIDQLTTPEGAHLDDTGEKRLRKLDPLLKDLRTLGQLYEKWQRCGASKNNTVAAGCWNDQPKFGDGREERHELPKLRSSNFGYLYGAYSRINHLHSAGEQLEKTAARGVKNVKAHWKGEASDAATADIHALGTTAENYQEILKTAGGNVIGLWRTMTNAVQKLADFGGGKQAGTLGGYVEQYHGMSVSVDTGIGDVTVELPDSEALNSYIDQMNLALRNGLAHAESGVMDVVKGSLVGGPIGGLVGLGYAMQDPEPSSEASDVRVDGNGLRRPSTCKLDGGHGDWWSNEACSYFDKFADDYHAVVKDLRKRITRTTKSVDDGLGQFTSGVSGLTSDPFGTLAPPDDTGNDTSDGHQPSRRGHTPPGSHHRPTSDGKGPPTTYDVDFGQGGTGLPGGGPDTPGAPGAGGTEHIQADENGKAVIHDGDDTITLDRASDGSGELTVTVDDGHGEPTTYTVDTPPDAPSGGSSQPAVPDGGSGGPGLTSEQDAAGLDAAGLGGGGLGGGGAGGGGATGGAGGSGGMPSTGGVVPETSASEAAEPQAGARSGVATDQPRSQAPKPTATEPAAAQQGDEARGGGRGMRGMPMMGGMGAGGGKGGDTDRGASKWRTSGDLFDDLAQVDPQSGLRPVDGVIGERQTKGR